MTNDIKIICKECQLKSVDVSKLDLEKHNNHIVNNNNEIIKLKRSLEELMKIIKKKSVILGDLCYICELTREVVDIEDLSKKK